MLVLSLTILNDLFLVTIKKNNWTFESDGEKGKHLHSIYVTCLHINIILDNFLIGFSSRY